MRTTEEWVATYQQRRRDRAPILRAAERMRDAVNGDLVLALETQDQEIVDGGAAVANLARQAINQYAVRAGSTLANLLVAPTRPGFKNAENKADTQRRALVGWWELNDFKLLQYRRLRLFAGYASSPVMIRPDFERGIPKWQVRNPLATYAPPQSDPDDMMPCDAIFVFTRTLAWLKEFYPDQLGGLNLDKDSKPDDRYQILECVDDNDLVMIATGRDRSNTGIWTPGASTEGWTSGPAASSPRFTELQRLPNRAGRCTVVMPGRITLDRPIGQFDGMLPMFIKRAKLSALEEIAIENGVFENEWFEHDGNGQIVTYASGREGIVGEVSGGHMVWHSLNPGYKTDSALDRLERQERVEAPLPAEMGAESASNVRTDRRGNTILSTSVDFTIGETHDVFAASFRKELDLGIDVSKGYFGSASTSFSVSWKGATGPVTYKPNDLFDTPAQVFVRWAMPGADVNGLTIGGLQRVGAGTLSTRGFMELDPLVDDVETEHDRIIAEKLEQALLTQISQPGGMSVPDLATVQEAVVTNRSELFQAVLDVQKQAQQAQATPAPPGAPETQPGLAQPGQTVGAQQPTMGPTPNEVGLAGLNYALRGAQRGIAA